MSNPFFQFKLSHWKWWILIGLILILGYSYLESRWLKVNRLEMVLPDLPNDFVGKKVVFISDIHHGPFFTVNRLKKLVKEINGLHPDIIILGGDYVYKNGKYAKPFYATMRDLTSKYGIYCVLGNHDNWFASSLSKSEIKKNKWNLCNNRSFWIYSGSDSIKIGGVGDWYTDKQYIDSTIYDVKKEDCCLLVSHNPNYINQLETDKVDLMLCGHTHGGQISLFGFWAPVIPPGTPSHCRYGLTEKKGIQIYITSGVGTLAPFRFFCRPEIVEITLKK